MSINIKQLRRVQETAEELAKQAEKQRRDIAPFVILEVWSLFEDKVTVYFYENPFSEPVVIRDTSLIAMLNVLADSGDDELRQYVDFGHCTEWTHLFYQNSPLYDEEQRARFKEDDIKEKPFLALLYDNEYEDIKRALSGYYQRMPLRECFDMDVFKSRSEGQISPQNTTSGGNEKWRG